MLTCLAGNVITPPNSGITANTTTTTLGAYILSSCIIPLATYEGVCESIPTCATLLTTFGMCMGNSTTTAALFASNVLKCVTSSTGGSNSNFAPVISAY